MNIILVGFKASGKSTIGKLLAELAGYRFVDTDSLIEAFFHKKNHLSISCREIFELKGEKYFRDLETEVLRQLKGLNNAVLSTGGGTALKEENQLLLQGLGFCVFLDVPLNVLKKRLENESSPLFVGKTVEELYKERYPIYLSFGQRFSVDANITPQQNARGVYAFLRDELSEDEVDEDEEDEDYGEDYEE
jgi:shikimate kinase